MGQMKVLVISNYRSTVGVRPEAEIFISLAKKGVEIDVMTYEDAEYVDRFRASGIRVIPFHPRKKFRFADMKRIRDTLKEGKHDIIQLYNSRTITNGIPASLFLPVKVVLYRGYTGGIHWYDPSLYFKYLHPRVDAIVCNSESVKELFDRQLFFSSRKTHVILKGHSLHWYKDIEPLDLAELGVPGDAFSLVAVANNREMKGIPILLKALEKFPQDLPVHLILVGKDMDNEENMAIIQNSPYKDNIHIVGFRTDVLRIVAAADVFVSSSLFGESLTKAVLEGMSLGKAPIISDIPGHRELVDDGENGLKVPAGDPSALSHAILRLYNDRELVQRFGMRSQRRVESHLSHQQAVAGFEQLYKSLIRTSEEVPHLAAK